MSGLSAQLNSNGVAQNRVIPHPPALRSCFFNAGEVLAIEQTRWEIVGSWCVNATESIGTTGVVKSLLRILFRGKLGDFSRVVNNAYEKAKADFDQLALERYGENVMVMYMTPDIQRTLSGAASVTLCGTITREKTGWSAAQDRKVDLAINTG